MQRTCPVKGVLEVEVTRFSVKNWMWMREKVKIGI